MTQADPYTNISAEIGLLPSASSENRDFVGVNIKEGIDQHTNPRALRKTYFS